MARARLDEQLGDEAKQIGVSDRGREQPGLDQRTLLMNVRLNFRYGQLNGSESIGMDPAVVTSFVVAVCDNLKGHCLVPLAIGYSFPGLNRRSRRALEDTATDVPSFLVGAGWKTSFD
ncbi:MAG: hypothetical protein H0V18_02390 [Pyrinomonadaceae bacterium]|nr:hypothetical protein [Pyrinomonadaceae bacterium]